MILAIPSLTMMKPNSDRLSWIWQDAFHPSGSGFTATIQTLHDCSSQDQLSKINNLLTGLNGVQDVMARYDPPCDEMNVVTNYNLRPYKVNTGNAFTDALLARNKLFLKFEYLDQTYQEVTNQRDFGFESFWSSAGGFVGLFLGVSLLQIVDMLFARIFKK